MPTSVNIQDFSPFLTVFKLTAIFMVYGVKQIGSDYAGKWRCLAEVCFVPPFDGPTQGCHFQSLKSTLLSDTV